MCCDFDVIFFCFVCVVCFLFVFCCYLLFFFFHVHIPHSAFQIYKVFFFFCEWILFIYLFHLLPLPRKWTVSHFFWQLQKMRCIEGWVNEKQSRGTHTAFCTLAWKAWVWKDLKIREFCWASYSLLYPGVKSMSPKRPKDQRILLETLSHLEALLAWHHFFIPYFCRVVVVDRFSVALFSTLEQTHCARMWFCMTD